MTFLASKLDDCRRSPLVDYVGPNFITRDEGLEAPWFRVQSLPANGLIRAISSNGLPRDVLSVDMTFYPMPSENLDSKHIAEHQEQEGCLILIRTSNRSVSPSLPPRQLCVARDKISVQEYPGEASIRKETTSTN